MSQKYIYFFGEGKAEGNSKMKNLLGGKGANLAEMTNIDIPVPPGFTITTEACIYYYQHRGKYPKGMKEEIDRNLKKKLGLCYMPLVTGLEFIERICQEIRISS